MIWKFPSRFPPVHMEELNPETMQELEQDQLKSTYQSDYTAIPQGKASEKVWGGEGYSDQYISVRE